MNLDLSTLLLVLGAQLVGLAAALPLLMGWRHISAAARCAQGSVLLQMAGWLALIGSGEAGAQEPLVASLGIAGLTAGQAQLWEAMRHWLGQRPGRLLVWTLAVAGPLGYGLGYSHYAWRVGWSNTALALQMLCVVLALVWPAPAASRRWRGLMALCLVALATTTLARGVLGGFYTEAYPNFRTPHPVAQAWALVSILSLTLMAVCLLVAWREEAERALAQQARTDPLTGLLNRRALQDAAEPLLAQAQRHREPLALLLIDLDHFKQVNDRLGHDGGDQALQLLATLLQQHLRRGDLAARWGGEEFCLLLPHTDAAAAQALDLRLRQALAAQAPAVLGQALAFSSGLTLCAPGDPGLPALLRRADQALYAAKAAGRNRLVLADPS
ncbi:MAG: GGDEF domain-containing protein [Burkholderiales bacterium PBB5]|nr:MAG: GGDEF domain-containing protein [Burkholderiales bacterium PBB5]